MAMRESSSQLLPLMVQPLAKDREPCLLARALGLYITL